MSLVIVNDFHLVASNPVCRLDNLVERQMAKLEFVIGYAADRGAAILSAGDLTDTPRNWYLLPKLSGLINNQLVRWYAVFGQHDTYQYSDKHRSSTNLGVLSASGLVDILGSEPMFFREYALYGCHWGGVIPTPVDDEHINVLCIHAPISVKPLFWDHSYQDAALFMEANPRYQLVACGDIHRGFEYITPDGRLILNTGPICRIEADEYMLRHEPCLYYVDCTPQLKLVWERVVIPHDPSEVVITRSHIEKVKQRDLLLKDFINMVNEGTVDDVNFLNNLRDHASKLDSELMNLIEHYIGRATADR